MRTIRAVRVALVLAAAAGVVAPAAAQTNDEVFPAVQWNFSTPGARANGMGRTFIGSADDASAAVTNPAGLMNLTKPQVYAEFKNLDVSVDRLATPGAFQTRQPTTFTANINALSFFSVSMPINNKLAVGFSYNQFLNYQENFNLSPRTLVDGSNNFTTFAAFGVQGNVDLKAASFGGSVSYALTKELMVGATISANRLTATATGTRYDFNFGPQFLQTHLDLQPLTTVINQTTIDDSSVKPGASVGILFRPNEMVQAGFTYTRSPRFKVGERFLRNAGGTNPATLAPFNVAPNIYPDPASLSINVPDRFGVGVAVRPMPRLLVGADVVRINYSSLAKDFLISIDFNSLPHDANFLQASNMFSIDDATEVHFGGEFNLVTGQYPVFVRAGVFTDPNHTTQFTPTAALPTVCSQATNSCVNTYYTNVYDLLPRETKVRGTVGAGVVLGPRVQIDAAYVHKREFVASTGVRF